MAQTTKKARAQIENREWVEIEVVLDSQERVEDVVWHAWGCHHLLQATEKAVTSLKSKSLQEIQWPGTTHWDLLISETFSRLKGEFQSPIKDVELCHCRKIPTVKVDEAIVLGAHTPEKVRAWTTASSGCGTCRPEVEKLISFRLKKAAV